MKWFVTGGAGFIGSSLVRGLVQDGESVLVADKLTYAGHLSSLKPVSSLPGFQFEKIDIVDFEAISAAVRKFEPDAIVHLAAESHVDRSITGAHEFIQTNIVGSFNVLEAARSYWSGLRGHKADNFRVLHVSTDEVYGSLGDEGFFTEETPFDPRSPYSASKAASDHLASAWHHTYGLPVLVSNCSNNYGPYQLPEKLIPLMLLNALEGRDLPVYGDGKNVRDWLYVDDHADALRLIVTRGQPGETYNIGGRNERSNIDVVHRICDLVDQLAPQSGSRRALIKHVADRPGHDRRYAIDATKAETQLGWKAKQTFETGLEATVRWYIDNEEWWRPLRAQGHGASRLGLLPAGVRQ